MASYKMEDFNEDIPEDFHCIICKNVKIEPFIELCECRFCSECIKEYLKDKRKHCPGIKIDCKEEYLEIDVNVTRDIKSARNIRRINVKCPNEMCEERRDLENMNDHLRLCGMSKYKCPYENIGCQLRQIFKDNVKTHYDNEWFTHSTLLVEDIDNLRNDVEELKKVVERRDGEINKLTEDSDRKEMTIKEMRIDIDILQKINDSKDREIEEIKEEFKMMEEIQKKMMMEELENVKKGIEERDLNRKKDIDEVKQQVDDQRKEINEIKIHDEKRDRGIETQKETQKEEFENVKKDVGEHINEHEKTLNNMNEKQEYLEKELSSVILATRDLQIYGDRKEFFWKVDNFTKMRNDGRGRYMTLWRNNLKLCLDILCMGDYLKYYCTIMKGEYDYILNWPMKHKITLSMLNQNTMKKHASREYHYDSFSVKSSFDKPVNEWNNFIIGDNYFMTIKEIIDSPGLLLNDSLIVSFIIDYN